MGRGGGGGGGGGGHIGGGGSFGGGGHIGGGSSFGGGGSFGGGSSYSGGSSHSGYSGGHSSGGDFLTGALVGGAVGSSVAKNRGSSGGGGGGGATNSGCGLILKWVLIFFVAMLVVDTVATCIMPAELMYSTPYSASYSDTSVQSTKERTPLPSSAVSLTKYYTDADGTWIYESATLEDGMKYFYEQTGVQPYLYILREGSADQATITKAAEGAYKDMFKDQGHFLFIVCGTSDGGMDYGYWVGSQAATVVDEEAIGIFEYYLEKYYTASLSDSQYFATVYKQTADRIMSVDSGEPEKSPEASNGANTFYAVIFILCLVGCVVVVFVKSRQRKAAEDKARTEKILNTPLEKFSDSKIDKLEDKYKDDKKPKSKKSAEEILAEKKAKEAEEAAEKAKKKAAEADAALAEADALTTPAKAEVEPEPEAAVEAEPEPAAEADADDLEKKAAEAKKKAEEARRKAEEAEAALAEADGKTDGLA